MSSMWENVFVLVRIVVLVYIGICIFLAGCQRGMIYYPTRSTEDNVLRRAAMEGLEPWRNADNEIIGWHPADISQDTPAMIVFHGNAGFATHRAYFVHGFDALADVYLFEYPGYGAREGKPSEDNFYKAGTDALKQLRAERSGPIYLAGESLGTGVAAYLAGNFPDTVDGLFLVTPFNSLVDVARSHYPVFPVRLLLRDRYPNEEHLQSYDGPVAILLAAEDEVVPARFGQKLYDEYDGPKRLWVQEGRQHNTLDLSPHLPLWQEVNQFLRSAPEETTN